MLVSTALFAASLAVPFAAAPGTPSTRHPLDPLSAAELARAAALVRADPRFPAGALFAQLALEEPAKAEVLAWKPGGAPIAREARAILLGRASYRAVEVVVDLARRTVRDWREAPGRQPPVMLEEYEVVTELVRADPRWQEAMRKRGITDFAAVAVDGWAAGAAFGRDRRIMRGLSFLQGKDINYYGRPIEGVVAVVDLDERKVIDVTDDGVVPVVDRTQDFDRRALAPLRLAPRPLVASQPQGPSFAVAGNEVRWQKWRFRFGYHPRDGLLLYTVGYRDGERLRPVLYRAGLSEMIVPYGDPASAWTWRSAFDVGEYGFGKLGSPLDRGLDVPATARLTDVQLADWEGKPYVLPRAVALYERDGGVLWKHYDVTSGRNVVRRARQLVLATAAAVGNYDYILSWVFHQDGTLELDAALTGILLAQGASAERVATAVCPGCTAHLVAPRILAPNHQHFFSFRLDLDVDGQANSLVEMNTRAVDAGAGNPGGNAFLMWETPLARESEARRDAEPGHHRLWKVASATATNVTGHPTAYALVPGESAPAYALAGLPPRQRAAFLEHALWATRHREGERYAAGDYPNQAAADEGLSRWTADDEALTGEDIVLWYTMGVTHVPRTEDWPIMNAHHLGFRLTPIDFFDRNAAMDVP